MAVTDAFLVRALVTSVIKGSIKLGLKLAAARGVTEEVAEEGVQYSDDLVKAAQDLYPKKAGVTELHHIEPIYLGGAKNGPLVPLDAAYHQVITNAFRTQWGYGQGPIKDPILRQQIIDKVYSMFPLP